MFRTHLLSASACLSSPPFLTNCRFHLCLTLPPFLCCPSLLYSSTPLHSPYFSPPSLPLSPPLSSPPLFIPSPLPSFHLYSPLSLSPSTNTSLQFDESTPVEVKRETPDLLREMKEMVDGVEALLTSAKMTQLFLIRSSPT